MSRQAFREFELIRSIQFAGVLLLFAVAAWGQSASDQPVCTDLSGKIRVACPGKDHSSQAAKSAAPATPNEPPESVDSQRKPQASADRPVWIVPARANAPSPSSGRVEAPPAKTAMGAPVPVVVRPVVTPDHSASPERSLPANFMADQKNFWTSPLRLRIDDARWLLPVAGAIAVTTLSDTDIERKLPTDASFIRQSKSFSNYGAAAYAGLVGSAYLWSRATHNDHLRETAVLSGEAAIDTLGVSEFAKYLAGRSRPLEGDGTGAFRVGGSSFPSIHAADAFAIATVVAHEYPGPFTQFLAYGSAAAIGAARVTGRQHFASDVLVGGALGWFIGRQVYRAHSKDEDRGLYGTFERTPREHGPADPSDMGSTYVPLDSWIYPAIDRLAALGYIHIQFAGMRPWTRMECARMLQEAGEKLSADSGHDNASQNLYTALSAEFAVEAGRLSGDQNIGAELESVYTRMTGISGKPLTDSYHFGQTIINDFGRPYQEGFNNVTGFTSHAEAGPLAFYVRGEFQHSPSAPGYPLNVRQAIATMDQNPLQPGLPLAGHDDFQFLDTYASLTIHNNVFSFGRQSIWWGPGEGGAMLFSDNALPMYMLRWSNAKPTKLPSLFGLLGPMRADIFIGRLSGHRFPSSPYISAQKITFKPTPNLEIGFGKLTVFDGGNSSITWHNFIRATFNYDNGPTADPISDAPGIDPGDRRGEASFAYKIPGLRNWLTIYADAISDDDPSPISAPRRAAMNPGIYLARVPGIPKLDFRAEAGYTDFPNGASRSGQFFYWNTNYHDSHTNQGNLMGSWIGREGRGLQMQSTYWISPRDRVEFAYRHGSIARDFVPNGGNMTDFSGRVTWLLNSSTSIDASLQHERWNVPLLSAMPQSNTVASFQISYWPKLHLKAGK